jgi:ABC-2 type transport system permease protein
MNSIWRIAQYEYRRNVFKKSFLLTLLSIPLMVTIGVGSGFVMVSLQNNDLPVGYIDQADVFLDPIPAPLPEGEEPVEFIAFQAEEEALAALEAKELQAFYIIPPDYSETRQIEIVYTKKPGANANRQWYDFLQINLVSDQPTEIAYRTAAGTAVTVRSLDGKRSVAESGPTFGNMMPLFITLAFLALILMSSGYLMGAVAEEKENRTMEIVVTSVSPMQLIGGKLLGIVAIGLTVLAAWTLIVILGIFAARLMGIGWFQDLGMDWGMVLSTAAVAIPAYALIGALMITIGTMVTSTQEGQSFSSIFIIFHMIPLYVSFAFIENPSGAVGVTLSLLPFTSLMTIAMRSLFYSVPTWQIAVSVGVQTVFALGAVWLASKSFRLGMLRYGQKLNWRGLLQGVSQVSEGKQ